MKGSLTPHIAYESAINVHVAALCVHRHNVAQYTLTVTVLTLRQCDVLKHKKLGKAIPLQAWRGPEGSMRLRLPDFKTVGT
jgi:hypothetical protein